MAVLSLRVTKCLVLLAIYAISQPPAAYSTVGYATATGLECKSCHVNPLGGGELTGFGQGYSDALSGAGGAARPSAVKRAIRLAVGYMHILAGVVWFGAIFYVHILLKPAYASKGLPRGELVLGWACIGAVALTGTLLTIARMDSLSAFYETRFGILLLVKMALFLVMAGTAAIATFVIGPRLKAAIAATAGAGGEFTPESLSGFDGKDGRKAYVAVDGVVYDVSASSLWKDGRHMRHLAGGDMTGAIRQAPHGPEKLAAMPVAGRLTFDAPRPRPGGAKAVFYVMAYMNLALVFLILGVVALWRWW